MRLFNWGACLLLFAGCSNVDTSMTILGAADSEEDDGCEFKGDSDKFLPNLFFDALKADSFLISLRVQNDLQGGDLNFGSGMLPDTFRIPNQITPLRMDFRFECDTNGFSDDLGPFYVPAFSVDQPFCLQKDTREFQGFDVVPASGASIAPASKGIVHVRPITAQLARAIGETIKLADLADQCCLDLDNVGGCTEDNLSQVAPGSNNACGELQTAFDKIAPQKLSVNKLEDVEKFRPFSIFDWGRNMPNVPATGGYGPGYPMRIRGVLEGVTGDGSVVSSNEYFDIIHICANCVQSRCTAF